LGVYSTDGSSLRMETPTTTMLICKSADIMQQEGTFLESLANVTEYRKEGDRLMAYTVEDQRLLTLAPAQPVSFEGTTWDLKFVYDDDEWLSLISGSTITAQFEDDQMSGSAGCNSYNATVSKEGETLTISNVASTRKACAEPEGIMEQESLYLSKLSSVKGLKTVGDALALLDADGQAILVLGAR
jgi:heat shock protein HslJ